MFSWEKLGGLARALGYPAALFVNNVEKEEKDEAGITFKDLNLMIDNNILYRDIDKTFNVHDAAYNNKVLKKSINILSAHKMSLSDINLARIAFDTYEHSDHAGVEDKMLLRALKLCDRTMAPMKMKQLLKRMNRLVPDRVMLYEFLDIYVSCDIISQIERSFPPRTKPSPKKDTRDLYELCDFEDELQTNDERLHKNLNARYQEYMKDILVTRQEEHDDTDSHDNNAIKINATWAMPPLADPTIRKTMAAKNAVQSKALSNYLNASTLVLEQCRCDTLCRCGVKIDELIDNREKRVDDVIEKVDEVKKDASPKALRKLDPSKVLVSEKELLATQRALEDLQFTMATRKPKQVKQVCSNVQE